METKELCIFKTYAVLLFIICAYMAMYINSGEKYWALYQNIIIL